MPVLRATDPHHTPASVLYLPSQHKLIAMLHLTTRLRQGTLTQRQGHLAPCLVSIVTAVCDLPEAWMTTQGRRLEACRWMLLHTHCQAKSCPGFPQDTEQPLFLLSTFLLLISGLSGFILWNEKAYWRTVHTRLSHYWKKCVCICKEKNLEKENKIVNDHFRGME